MRSLSLATCVATVELLVAPDDARRFREHGVIRGLAIDDHLMQQHVLVKVRHRR